jgi:hypothetical protein
MTVVIRNVRKTHTVSDTCGLTLGDDWACGCDSYESSDRECVLHNEGLGVLKEWLKTKATWCTVEIETD